MSETSITKRYEAQHRRALRWSLVVSLLFHIAFLLFFRSELRIPPSPFAAVGPRSGDARAAAGGGTQIVAVNIVPTPPQPVPEVIAPVPVPLPIPEPEIKPVLDEPPRPQAVAAAAAPAREGTGVTGEGRGEKTGEGMEGGTGRGDGGTAEEGLFRLVPPSPRGLILPPSDRPGKVRGKEIDVWVFVTMKGEVVPDSTRIAPPSGDRKFDERLRKQASEWVFEPAKKEGRAISEWFRYTLIL